MCVRAKGIDTTKREYDTCPWVIVERVLRDSNSYSSYQ